MQTAHLKALQQKYEKLQKEIRDESLHAARNDVLIENLKKRRMHLLEEMDRAQKAV